MVIGWSSANGATVVNNFLPVFYGDRRLAERAARAAHRNFAAKLVDLWRVEGGEVTATGLRTTANWKSSMPPAGAGAARCSSRCTLATGSTAGLAQPAWHPADDPHPGRAGRRPDRIAQSGAGRYGVDTLIIGDDSFAFVEVIKQLQAGADMAVSLDRPPDRGGVPVEFFGHPFEASLAAAELARASGCAMIGVTIVRRPKWLRCEGAAGVCLRPQGAGQPRSAPRIDPANPACIRAGNPQKYRTMVSIVPAAVAKAPMNRISRVRERSFAPFCFLATMASVPRRRLRRAVQPMVRGADQSAKLGRRFHPDAFAHGAEPAAGVRPARSG
jgi:hypothetical protein